MAEYSPMMQHYLATKAEYKDCILFYRLGDFYEMFFDDALVVSKELELTLTGKDCGQEERAPMCGVPFHAAETYINRLVSNGHKVAICEQMEDPKQAKGIVKREVIKVVTPGTNLNSQALDEMNPLILQMRFTATRTDTRPRLIATAKRLLYQETADKTTRSGYQYLHILHFSFI